MFRKIKYGILVLIAGVALCQATMYAFSHTGYYHVKMDLPNGKEGFYRMVPKIVIKSTCEEVSVRYFLQKPDQRNSTGRLKGNHEKTILDGVGRDGRYIVDVWAENQDGQMISGSEYSRTFYVDGKVDGEVRANWDEAAREVEVIAQDSLSGIKEIRYRLGEGRERRVKGAHGFFTVPETFEGEIYAYATDVAGNQGEVSEVIKVSKRSEVVRNTPPSKKPARKKRILKPVIQVKGFDDYDITNQDVHVRIYIKNRKYVKRMHVKLLWEKPSGECKIWKSDQKEMSKHLREDGIYQVTVKVVDQQGRQYRKKQQVIIDKTNPYIRPISDAQLGKRIGIEDVVDEFTSYTYELIDDRILHVTDAAGNESKGYLSEILRRDYVVSHKELW